jgi:hypothetical protein
MIAVLAGIQEDDIAALERPALMELERRKSELRGGNPIPAGQQFRQLVGAGVIGRRHDGRRGVGVVVHEVHHGPRQRTAVLACDVTADAGSCLWHGFARCRLCELNIVRGNHALLREQQQGQPSGDHC